MPHRPSGRSTLDSFSNVESSACFPNTRRAQHPRLWTLLLPLLLSACASVAPERDQAALQTLTEGRTAGVSAPWLREPAAIEAAVAELLRAPLGASEAVRLALLNNPSLQAALNRLDISDAERVQAARAPNPYFGIGRFSEGEKLEIERLLRFDVVGLLFLPWKSAWQERQHTLARLDAAQTVVRLATETRKAWVSAVAAQQMVQHLTQVLEAAQAGAELAQRMAQVGNFSRLQQAREQLLQSDAAAQLARARHTAFVERERLTRLMGLWGEQTQYTLTARLPDLPAALPTSLDVEAQALRERLDVRAALTESAHLAESMGVNRVAGYLSGSSLDVVASSIFDNAAGTQESRRGVEIKVPLPVFDLGGARQARAQAEYQLSVNRLREVGVLARSEARQSWHAWRTTYDLARLLRDEVVPLRRTISEESLLRYNGMLSSVWALLGDVRQQSLSVSQAIEAQRDFWLADADLQLTLTGTSAAMLAPTSRPGTASPMTRPSAAAGH